MNAGLRKSLVAGAIAALVSVPGWAAGEAGSTGAAGTSGAQMSSEQASNPLYSMTPQQLQDMDVVSATGEEIGSVSKVVSGRAQEGIQLVISSGGVAGVGGKEVAVPLNEASLQGDKIQVSSSKAELEAQPEYQAEQFVEVQPADQPISDFAAFEPLAPGQEGQQQPGRTGEPTQPEGGTSPRY